MFMLKMPLREMLTIGVIYYNLEEGEWLMVNNVKVREGKGKMVDGEEVYKGDWKGDAMHGEGERERERELIGISSNDGRILPSPTYSHSAIPTTIINCIALTPQGR